MKKVNVGLDIGIASVGWAIVNAEEFEIIDAGSRLFEEANNIKQGAAASIRREYRTRRRNLRRDKLRRDEMKKLFVEQKWIQRPEDFESLQPTLKNVYQLRLEALSQPKSPQELMLIFSNFLKHRGIFNLKDEAIEEAKKNKKTDLEEVENAEKDLEKNDDDNLWACEIQLRNLAQKGSVKGSHNKLPHDKYRKELCKILETQKYYSRVDGAFCEKFLNLFDRRRQYYEGPGKNSPFGWEGNQEVFYQRLLGFDSYDRNEVRAPKMGFYANLYNVLNDLNNLKIMDEQREDIKLSLEEKQRIIGSIFDTKGKPANLTLNRLSKLIHVPEKKIEGYRINKDGKSEFTIFEVINKIFKCLEKANISIDWLNLEHADLLDDLSLIMTQGQSYDYRQEQIQKCLERHQINNSSLLASKLAIISFNGSHALSNKTIKSLLPELWNKPHPAQHIFAERKIRPQYHFQISSQNKYVPLSVKEIQEMYISPVAKRSFIQALKVLKQIQKYCDGKYDIEGVFIELARERNTDDQKEFIKSQQRNNEKLAREIRTITTIQDPFLNLSAKTLRKLRLLIEQGFKCAYCFQELNWHEVQSKDWFSEVDHIIPESISFSTNSDNLVLVHQHENHEKGKTTPYRYFNSQNTPLSWGQWQTKVRTELYTDFLAKNKKSQKYIKRKIQNLLNETDFDNLDNVREFVERNLNDTRTSTKALKEYLEECCRQQKLPFQIKTINGQFTDFIKRYYFDLPKKNRDRFEHHAIDAIAIAYSDWARKHRLNPHEWSVHKPAIKTYDFRFSKMANHNINKRFTDETLYSFRKNQNEEFVKIQKIDIFTTDLAKRAKLNNLLTQESQRVLMAQADPFTFQRLQQIWNEYPIGMKYMADGKEHEVQNPFVYYRDVLKTPLIKMQNKKGIENPELNPPIKTLRYEDGKLSKHFDVTHKYPLTKENKIVAFESFNPIRLDFYRHRFNNQLRVLMLNIQDVRKMSEDGKTIEKNHENYNYHKAGLKITDAYELVAEIFPGDTIEFERNQKRYLAVVVGGVDTRNILEIKHIHRNKIKEADKKSPLHVADKRRIFIPVLSITNLFRKNFDILGVKSSQYMLEFNQ